MLSIRVSRKDDGISVNKLALSYYLNGSSKPQLH